VHCPVCVQDHNCHKNLGLGSADLFYTSEMIEIHLTCKLFAKNHFSINCRRTSLRHCSLFRLLFSWRRVFASREFKNCSASFISVVLEADSCFLCVSTKFLVTIFPLLITCKKCGTSFCYQLATQWKLYAGIHTTHTPSIYKTKSSQVPARNYRSFL
jgi:hypothetical protein